MERYYSLLEWLSPAHAASMLKSMTGIDLNWNDVVTLCKEGHCPGYALRRPRGKPAVYQQVPPKEINLAANLLLKPEDIKIVAAKINGMSKQSSAAEVETLRRQLEQERTARQASEQRAEQAEAEVAELRLQMAAVGTTGQHSSGLYFPYATKQLEAARDAALKYWCDFNHEHPPLQKSIAGFMIERGVPARQAQELTIAIKPDDLQKA
jgi:hypothetical protein